MPRWRARFEDNTAEGSPWWSVTDRDGAVLDPLESDWESTPLLFASVAWGSGPTNQRFRAANGVLVWLLGVGDTGWGRHRLAEQMHDVAVVILEPPALGPALRAWFDPQALKVSDDSWNSIAALNGKMVKVREDERGVWRSVHLVSGLLPHISRWFGVEMQQIALGGFSQVRIQRVLRF